jgi:predicted RNase H-like HicB family nuclease
MTMQFKVVFEASDDGGYTVHVPALPGCISEGDTVDEARSNILEAIALYREPGQKGTGTICSEGIANRAGPRASENAGEPLVVPAGSFVEEISI